VDEAPSQTQVRYFHRDDERAATDIAKRLQSLVTGSVVLWPAVDSNSSSPIGQFEVWVAPEATTERRPREPNEIRYAQFVELAERVNGDDNKLKAELAKVNYTFVRTIYGNELATDTNPGLGGDSVYFGFLARSSTTKELVVSIRGSATLLKGGWMHDARFDLVHCPIPRSVGMTEDGFTAVYSSLRIDKDPASPRLIEAIKAQLAAGTATSVTVCGYSLGGALATFVGMDVALNSTCKSPLVYSYASPRVGDPKFAQQYDTIVPRTSRIANRFDIVPQLPPPGPPILYEHVKTLFDLTPPLLPSQVKSNIDCMHRLNTYVWLLAKKAGVGDFRLDGDCKPAQ
jgi:hypothetical protein